MQTGSIFNRPELPFGIEKNHALSQIDLNIVKAKTVSSMSVHGFYHRQVNSSGASSRYCYLENSVGHTEIDERRCVAKHLGNFCVCQMDACIARIALGSLALANSLGFTPGCPNRFVLGVPLLLDENLRASFLSLFMLSLMTNFAESFEVRQEFIAKSLISAMVNVVYWKLSASLANAIAPMKDRFTLCFPFGRPEVLLILAIAQVFWAALNEPFVEWHFVISREVLPIMPALARTFICPRC